MVGLAVKVTELPGQIVVALAPILTLAGKLGFTVIVMALLVAGLPVEQGVAFEVITAVTTWPLVRVVVVNVALLVPTGVTPTNH